MRDRIGIDRKHSNYEELIAQAEAVLSKHGHSAQSVLWNESYERRENFLIYPLEEVVKFLTKYKPRGRGIDLGCGIGRQTQLLEEFHLTGYGVDVSHQAIDHASRLHKGNFYVVTDSLPFDDNYFSTGICAASLDSMSFETAKGYIKEIQRTVTGYTYISLISYQDSNYKGNFEQVLDRQHEKGTTQCFYNEYKMDELLEGMEIVSEKLTTETEGPNVEARYHLVVK